MVVPNPHAEVPEPGPEPAAASPGHKGVADKMDEIVLHTEEVSQILGVPPHWLVRRGAVVMLGIVALMIALTFVVHYPDVVTADVVVTMPTPPAKVVAEASGHLSGLAVRQDQMVDRGAVLARIQSATDPEAVTRLAAMLAIWSAESRPSDRELAELGASRLGELAGSFAAAVRATETHAYRMSTRSVDRQVQGISAQYVTLQGKTSRLQSQRSLLQQQADIARRTLAQYKKLAERGYAAATRVNEQEQALLEAQRAIEMNSVELADVRLEREKTSQTIAEMTLREQQERQDLRFALEQALKVLRSRVSLWEQRYVLRAPIAGRISLSRYWSDSQFIRSGDEVMAIIPAQAQKPLGRALLAGLRAGSVQVGQRAQIRLENYPAEQFGMLVGRVSAISPVPVGGQYAVELSLPPDMTTTLGKTLRYQQEMRGQADITVEDLRIIDRIMSQFRGLSTRDTQNSTPPNK